MTDDSLTPPDGPFVSATWLLEHLHHPALRVLDTRGKVPPPGETPQSRRGDWAASHIPGAAFVEWNRDFVDVADPVPNQLAGADGFAQAAGRQGIDAGTVVVAYDDSASIFAGRLWWAFRAMGHDAVRVLDGGWPAWLAAGGPTTDEAPSVRPATFVPRPRAELRRTIDEVADRSADAVLLDARAPDRYAGAGADPVGGHIPGARNVPYAALVDERGLLRPEPELRAAFARVGIDPDSPPAELVSSCGSGISASVPLLALEFLNPGAGARGAVYDGSWAEWSASGRPIATGAQP